MLLPMYFLIGRWGGPEKTYAAMKFFLYTFSGSILILFTIIILSLFLCHLCQSNINQQQHLPLLFGGLHQSNPSQ
jgi:NADH-quinone oxidoreductase subunit M